MWKFTFLFISLTAVFGQERKMKTLDELIIKEDSAWPIVLEMVKNARNPVFIVEGNKDDNKAVLYQTQVTTRSPMGAITYETGGIFVDKGWLRILGGTSKKMGRDIGTWNFPKEGVPKIPGVFLVADDVLGGFFAINGGALGDQLGKVFYFGPDTLQWENTNLGYSEFLNFAFNGDLELFYKDFRWKGWQEEISELSGEKGISVYPFLWSKELPLEKRSRKPVPILELLNLNLDFQKQLIEAQEP